MHQYFTYIDYKPGDRLVREITQLVANAYLGNTFSISKLKKMRFTVECSDPPKKWRSKEISFDKIERNIVRNHRFDSKEFDLIDLKCEWLDGDVDISLPQHFVGDDGLSLKIKLPLPMGDKFPIQPTLDREGVMYNSFQKSLTQRIILLRSRLVENSNDFKSHDWLYDLIALISSCVSLVDITLNQLYIKAEYMPLDSWKFSRDILGDRINRRIQDKFRWIGMITGKPLDNVEKELSSFHLLRELRNHTQHFDPPCFGFTMEEAAIWLNCVHDIGVLLLKIRSKIDSKFNEQLIELALLPNVAFHGKTLFARNRAEHIETGYSTTVWNISNIGVSNEIAGNS